MACGRVLPTFIILVLSLTLIQATVYSRCRLTRELLKLNFSRTFLSNWVCLIEQESDRSTSALLVKSPRRKYYGLFQIGSEWCKEGRRGGKCDMSCESFLNDDIKDDATCAQKIFEMEGFKYWSKWEARCKGHTLPDIENIDKYVNKDEVSGEKQSNAHVPFSKTHSHFYLMSGVAVSITKNVSSQRQEEHKENEQIN